MASSRELHQSGGDSSVFCCSSCCSPVETGFHCTVCDDYNLCIKCHREVDHPHQLEKVGLGPDSVHHGERQENPQEAHRQSIQHCLQVLMHACQCRDASCLHDGCPNMKRMVAHTGDCRRKVQGDCPICKQLLALGCHHAKDCSRNECPMPCCKQLKQQMLEQQGRSSSASSGKSQPFPGTRGETQEGPAQQAKESTK